jgi:cobalt/nickel transport system permease protein
MTLAWRESSVADSLLSRWDSRWQLAAFLLFGLGVLLQEQFLTLSISFLLTIVLALLARVQSSVLVARIGLLLLVAIPLLVVVPLTKPSAWPLAVSAGLRLITLGILSLTLLRSQPISQILAAAHHLKFPRILIILVQLTYRYSFVIAAEVRRMRIALRSRGFRLKTDLHTYRTMSYAIGGVLVQSSDRAERVSEAMRCRGFDGDYHSLTRFQTQLADVLGFLLLISCGIAILMLDHFT